MYYKNYFAVAKSEGIPFEKARLLIATLKNFTNMDDIMQLVAVCSEFKY